MARERKNVNLPGVVVDLPTLTAKDEEDLVKWGVPNDIDFIAASFVRKGSDLDYIRKVLFLLTSSRAPYSIAPI
jgi:pyruvate kinase